MKRFCQLTETIFTGKELKKQADRVNKQNQAQLYEITGLEES